MKKDIEYYKNYDLENLTEEDLLNNINLAMGLAKWNNSFGEHELAEDFKILSLNNGEVAKALAFNSGKNGWGKSLASADSLVRELCDGDVAWWLDHYCNDRAFEDVTEVVGVEDIDVYSSVGEESITSSFGGMRDNDLDMDGWRGRVF